MIASLDCNNQNPYFLFRMLIRATLGRQNLNNEDKTKGILVVEVNEENEQIYYFHEM